MESVFRFLKTLRGSRTVFEEKRILHSAMDEFDPTPPPPFALKRHVAYFKTNLLSLPEPYKSLDTSRLNALFFCVASLDVMGALDVTLAKVAMTRSQIIDTIYAAQLLPSGGEESASAAAAASSSGTPAVAATAAAGCEACGFRGNFLGAAFDAGGVSHAGDAATVDTGHIAMTFCALATLAVLGDTFERVQRDALVVSLRALQQPSGSFAAVPVGGEDDMRFLYCACCISHMLGDWRGVDIPRAVAYIESCRGYDGGIGMFPGSESHGGSMFTALASLALIARRNGGAIAAEASASSCVADREPDLGPTIDAPARVALVRWCSERIVAAEGGFQGRVDKKADTCYSWWIGGSLKILGHYDIIPALTLRKFHASCAFAFGGFAKLPAEHPDILHSFMSILAHSMIAHELALDGGGDLLVHGLKPIDPCLMIPLQAVAASPFGTAV
jgi:geranylgeranyl transferase type-1 subunit beta